MRFCPRSDGSRHHVFNEVDIRENLTGKVFKLGQKPVPQESKLMPTELVQFFLLACFLQSRRSRLRKATHRVSALANAVVECSDTRIQRDTAFAADSCHTFTPAPTGMAASMALSCAACDVAKKRRVFNDSMGS